MTHGNTEDVRIAPLIDRRSYVRKHVTIVVGPRELARRRRRSGTMPLTWDATTCADQSMLDESEWAVTEALIFATMYVGLGEITDKTAEKFTQRLNVWSKVFGPAVTIATASGVEPLKITLADVQRRIGLRTNASRLTDQQFRGRMITALMRDAAEDIARQKRAAESNT